MSNDWDVSPRAAYPRLQQVTDPFARNYINLVSNNKCGWKPEREPESMFGLWSVIIEQFGSGALSVQVEFLCSVWHVCLIN